MIQDCSCNWSGAVCLPFIALYFSIGPVYTSIWAVEAILRARMPYNVSSAFPSFDLIWHPSHLMGEHVVL